MEAFSRALVELMKRNGMSQADLSRISGVKKSAISTYVNDTSEPSLINARKIADALNVRIDMMVGLEPSGDLGRLQLNDDEQELIDVYRSTDARGRDAIMAVARSQAGDEGASEAGARSA